MKRTFIITLISSFLCFYNIYSRCNDNKWNGETLDYSQEKMWYKYLKGHKSVDVFYITPTCIWDWGNYKGDTIHYMNIEDTKQRAAVDGANYLASSLFSKSCRFYSPYYRQITMNSWMQQPKEIERRYEAAHKDIVKAFNYYMKYLNQGRPYILAGHSQGAKAVLELLKHNVSNKQLKKMIAAYLFGYEIKQSDLESYEQLMPAKDSLDYGVIINYNSVSSPKSVSSLFKDNVVCINPINWHTDSKTALPQENIGSVFFDKNGIADTLYNTVGARLDTTLNTLIIDGLEDTKYHIPSIATLFPKGYYHVQEINLYYLNIQKNIRQRIDSYYSKTKCFKIK